MYIVLTMYGSFLQYNEVLHNGCNPSGNGLLLHEDFTHQGQPTCKQTGQQLFNALIGVAFAGLGLAQLAASMEGITQARVAAHTGLNAISRQPGSEEQIIYKSKNQNDGDGRKTSSQNDEPDDTDSTSDSSNDEKKKNETIHSSREHCCSANEKIQAILPRYEINALADGGLRPRNIQGSILLKNVYFSYPVSMRFILDISCNIFSSIYTIRK